MYIHVTSIWQLCELENILYPLSIYFHIAKIRMENWPIWSLSYYWGFFLKRFFFSWQQRNIQVPKLQRTLRNKGSDSNNLWMCLNYNPSLSLNACRLIMLDYCVGQHTEILYELGKKADHTLWTIQGSPNWGHTAPVGGALGGPPYLVNVWQAAASRIAGDTTSWVAGGDVGHLWVQAVGQVKSGEVCWELHVHTHNIHTDGQ